MEITNYWRGDAHGRPALYIEFGDGSVAVLTHDQKLNLLNDHGVVFLGSRFQPLVAVQVQIEGRTETLEGFTNDPTVVALYREFLEG